MRAETNGTAGNSERGYPPSTENPSEARKNRYWCNRGAAAGCGIGLARADPGDSRSHRDRNAREPAQAAGQKPVCAHYFYEAKMTAKYPKTYHCHSCGEYPVLHKWFDKGVTIRCPLCHGANCLFVPGGDADVRGPKPLRSAFMAQKTLVDDDIDDENGYDQHLSDRPIPSSRPPFDPDLARGANG